MNEHEVTMAQAEIRALTEAWHTACSDRDQWKRRAEFAEALLAQHGLGTADEATEPEDVRSA